MNRNELVQACSKQGVHYAPFRLLELYNDDEQVPKEICDKFLKPPVIDEEKFKKYKYPVHIEAIIERNRKNAQYEATSIEGLEKLIDELLLQEEYEEIAIIKSVINSRK